PGLCRHHTTELRERVSSACFPRPQRPRSSLAQCVWTLGSSTAFSSYSVSTVATCSMVSASQGESGSHRAVSWLIQSNVWTRETMSRGLSARSSWANVRGAAMLGHHVCESLALLDCGSSQALNERAEFAALDHQAKGDGLEWQQRVTVELER